MHIIKDNKKKYLRKKEDSGSAGTPVHVPLDCRGWNYHEVLQPGWQKSHGSFPFPTFQPTQTSPKCVKLKPSELFVKLAIGYQVPLVSQREYFCVIVNKSQV